MGRAIDMENDIDSLKIKVEKLENQVRGMISKIDEISEKFKGGMYFTRGPYGEKGKEERYLLLILMVMKQK